MSVTHTNPVTQAGYMQIPNAVALRRDLKPAAKLVYGYLKHVAWRARADDIAPPRETIANDLGIDVRMVTTCIKALSAAPVLEGDESPDAIRLVVTNRRGLGLTNTYSINDPELPAPEPPKPPDGKEETAFQENTEDDSPTRARSRPRPRPRPRPRSRTLSNNQELRQDLAPAAGNAPTDPPKLKPGPPKLTKVEGANVGWDALVEVTLANPLSERGRIGTALKIIRSIAFTELAETVPDDPDSQAWLIRIQDEGSLQFEQNVAGEIRNRARLYRERWPGVDLTTTALAANWHRVLNPIPQRGMTSAEIRAMTQDDLDANPNILFG